MSFEKHQLAYPLHEPNENHLSSKGFTNYGITKYEYLVIEAMNGILAAQIRTGFLEPDTVARKAVEQADAIMNALNTQTT